MKKIKQNHEIERIPVDDSVLLVQDNSTALLLDETGREIIDLFRPESTIESVDALMRQKYGQSYIQKDLLDFIEEMISKRVLIAV